MNNETWTPEPWQVDIHGLHVFAGERLVAGCGGHQDNFTPNLIEINQANARRIVAAVNYCEGVKTLEIESAPKHLQLRHLLAMIDNGLPAYIATVDALQASNKELADALRIAQSYIEDDSRSPRRRQAILESFRIVLAKELK